VSPRRAGARRARRPGLSAPPGPDVEATFARQQAARDRCAQKQWFATESEARALALMHRTQWGEDRVVYACDLCGGWHLARRPAG
jgi:hypothetical protein